MRKRFKSIDISGVENHPGECSEPYPPKMCSDFLGITSVNVFPAIGLGLNELSWRFRSGLGWTHTNPARVSGQDRAGLKLSFITGENGQTDLGLLER
jgi:hypothetical protein